MAISPTELDVAAVRQDFPLLQGTMNGQPLTYLDSAATSQKPRAVIDAIVRYYEHGNANVHRGVYTLANEATEAYEGARAKIAAFINATPEETIFVRNASEGINLVARTWGATNLGPGDLIAVTLLEHHSNFVPWQMLAQSTGAEIAWIGLLPDGAVDIDALDRALETGRVKLVATAMISNVLGTIVPIDEVARKAHAHGALVLADAAQAVPHVPVDVRALDVDFLAFTGHKMLGPMGIGVLFGRRALLEGMPPFLFGGEMIRSVRTEGTTWNDLPWKFEAGTPSVGDAVGLGAAVEYLTGIGMEAIARHDRQLAAYAVEQLETVPGVRVFGPEKRGAVAAFWLEGIHPHDVATILDEQGIAVRAGQHCAEPLHEVLGVPATTRASFYLYNDESDVDRLIEGLAVVRRVLGS
jgi:cysteine desulfurase / selenocysteine lyase